MDILKVKSMLALLFSLCLIPKHADSTKYKGRKDYRIKTQYVAYEISAASQVQCLLFCSMHDSCVSASYKSASNCLLSAAETTHDQEDSPGIPEELESVEGWATFSRTIYPVFHAIGSYTRYSMTFALAEDVCRGYGTTVATRSDLLEARALGYQRCVCGWLSDESIGFVMQAHYLSCSSTYNEEIIPCYMETANVWCKVM